MLNKRIMDILQIKGWSVLEFAEKCEMQEELPIETTKNICYGRTTDPKCSTLLKMSNVLDISMNDLMGKSSHSEEEQKILDYYKQCGVHGKSIIQLIAKYEATSAKAYRDSYKKHKIPCLVPNSNVRFGFVYDTCETVEIVTTVQDAFCGIKVTTNDLVPTYCKGDIILFANRFPTSGEYAAFICGDRAFLRKFVEEDGQYRLKCIHNESKDIVLRRMDEVEYIGTCINVVRA